MSCKLFLNLLTILAISIVLIMFLSKNSNAEFMNRFKEGFYFEKYRTADKARSDLYR